MAKKREGNPIVTVRLRPQTIRMLKSRAKQMEYKDVSAFLRDFIESTATGNLTKAQEFMQRMIQSLAQEAALRAQMALPGLEDKRPSKRGGR